MDDVKRLMAYKIKMKVIENPLGVISTRIRKPTQIVQPYQFGHDASKKTCLWILDADGNDLTPIPLDPSKFVPGVDTVYKGRVYKRWANQAPCGATKQGPSENRWKDRSRTFPGIAEAVTDYISTMLLFAAV